MALWISWRVAAPCSRRTAQAQIDLARLMWGRHGMISSYHGQRRKDRLQHRRGSTAASRDRSREDGRESQRVHQPRAPRADGGVSPCARREALRRSLQGSPRRGGRRTWRAQERRARTVARRLGGRVRRGEGWWAPVDRKRPVLLV